MKKITKGARQMATISFTLTSVFAGGYLIYKKTDDFSFFFKNNNNLKDWSFDSKLFDDFSIEKFKEVIKNNNFDTSIGSLVSVPQMNLPPANSMPNIEEEIPSVPKTTQDDDDDDEDDDTEEGDDENEKNKSSGDKSIAEILQLIQNTFKDTSSKNSDFEDAIKTLQGLKDEI